ncbi:MAG: bifunctional NADH-specific enoyl-ACP reductase/trans-2-enoyl-CoA reductase [Acidobacteria bacterium]|nr:MAG: bifunctional NADH-specific enoyl-ACP reductase/trans-2-enoyl-CoA reductase [Acidobacteriota bacterium]
MSRQVIKRRSRGFICVNAHPEGCRLNVERQIAVAEQAPPREGAPRNVLVIGASTGYGLASRIAAGWGYGARTLGVFFERPPDEEKTATAGYYNTVALDQRARRDGLLAAHINGDAFSDECKREAIEIVRRELAPLDLIIYSLASPKRAHPRTGVVHNSVLKPIGQPYSNRTIELDSEKVVNITLPPASEREISDTVAVMGGDDWRMWIDALAQEGLLAPGVRALAYSYIGPELTWPIYRDGTIGRAKNDLEQSARLLDAFLSPKFGGRALICVNKAVVTQASAAIPVVPLYVSLLIKVMTEKGLEEGPIEQMRRLFADLGTNADLETDETGRLRLDDREMRTDVQAEIARLWPQVTTENLRLLADFASFQRQFRNLFGFDVEGVDYQRPVETNIELPPGR